LELRRGIGAIRQETRKSGLSGCYAMVSFERMAWAMRKRLVDKKKQDYY
jgi:hypothetical protein